jgi:structure-specific endonuclease subunit SLX1
MMNLHLLLRVQSFARWPLSLRFLASDVFHVWQTNEKKANQSIRSSIEVTLDPLAVDTSVKRRKDAKADSKSVKTATSKDQPKSVSKDQEEVTLEQKEPANVTSKTASAIDQLDFGYSAIKPHLEKSMALLSDGGKVACSCCKQSIKNDPLVVVCPHSNCSAVSHIQCLSTDFLWREQGRDGNMIITPIQGPCPSCNTTTKWQTLIQELSLRLRGQKEIEQLFRARKKGKSDAKMESNDNVDLDEYEDISRFLEFEEEESRILEGPSTDAVESNSSPKQRRTSPKLHKDHKIPHRDSDWTGVEVLD